MPTDSVSYTSLANAVRGLSIDAVEKANSGHPGLPLGMADVTTVLFRDFLSFNPQDPKWINRDRFILSAGHGSMLLYSLLHLTGYDLSIDDLKAFRQYGSKTPGHPEYGHTQGVETTTGPLGQGLANGVGVALGEAILHERFGKLISHKTYVLAGDGCLMEGITQEAISFAGHLGLRNLIVLFDDNGITIDGKVSLSSSENIKMRFESCDWKVIEIDGHDFTQIKEALVEAQNAVQPTLISCRTIIGYGSPHKAGSEKAHGSPLGLEEAKLTKDKLNWKALPFEVPQPIKDAWLATSVSSLKEYDDWQEQLSAYDKRELLEGFFKKDLPQVVKEKLNEFKKKQLKLDQSTATRKSSHLIIQEIGQHLPSLIGGSADLTGSNLTQSAWHKIIQKGKFSGNYLHYGIREHGMAGIMNGLSLYGLRPYGGSFLIFSDYARPSIRLAALMQLPVIYILTHDSVGLGEDGPTHQPVEHLSSLRAIPNLNVFRPCDTIETAEAWELALSEKQTPSVLALSRQAVPPMRNGEDLTLRSNAGGYLLWSNCPDFEAVDLTLIASGSEVHLAYEIALELDQKKLGQKNKKINLISMPCLDFFKKKSQTEQDQLISPNSKKVVLEAGIKMSWDFLLGREDHFFGVETFGLSAPYEKIYQHFGLTKQNIITKILKHL